MTEPSSAPAPAPAPARKVPFLPAIVLIAAISTCSIYANLSFIVTHELPLEEAPRGYELFERKLEGAIKVLLKPS